MGRLVVHAEDGVATVRGRADIIRGQAKIIRSHFKLDGGSVTFIDNDPFQPFVITHGNMALPGGVTIEMNLRGTPTGADVHFSSSQIEETDQVLSAVITGKNPENSSGNLGVASTLASAVLMRVFLPKLDLGAFEYRQGLLQLHMNLGKQFRLTPMLGFSTAHGGDNAALHFDWFPTPRTLLFAHVGNLKRHIGFAWQRRF